MDDVRGKLARLAGHSAVADEVDARTLAHASSRADAITARLDEIRPRVLLDQDAADEYERLAEERGRLRQLVARLSK